MCTLDVDVCLQPRAHSLEREERPKVAFFWHNESTAVSPHTSLIYQVI